MGFLGFLVTVAFLPIPGGFTNLRFAAVAFGASLLWYFRPGRLVLAHVIGAVFLAACALSLGWTFSIWDGVFRFAFIGALGLAFCAGAGTQETIRPLFVGAGIGIAVNSVLAIGQYFDAWMITPQATMPAGLFFNKNILGETAALVLVGLVGYRVWWLIIPVLPSVILTGARGSLFALAASGILLIWRDKRLGYVKYISVLAAVAVGVHVMNTSDTFIQRLQIWHDTWDGLTFWGRGIGSFWAAYPEHASRIDPLALRAETAHNDLLQMLFEVGVLPTLVFVTFVASAMRGPLRTEHYVLTAFIVEGLVGFPLSMPATGCIAAISLGHICRYQPDLHVQLADLRRLALRALGRRTDAAGKPAAAAARR